MAGLAMLGALLPLSLAGAGHSYAAIFWPGADALSGVSRAGSGWRIVRVVASRPVPILILAHEGGEGQRPSALLLPVPLAPGCLFADPGR